jgi:cytochrome c oxidase subunit 2
LNGLVGSQVELQDGTTMTADDSYIRESIVNSQAKIVAGFDPLMPIFQGLLSEDQLAQIVAYIKSLSKTEGTGK